MNKELTKDAFGWGFLLWLIGYVLGIILFFFVPHQLIGWVILPIGVLITMWVLLKKIKPHTLPFYLILSVSWTAIAVLLDYLFIVKTLKPADGYYKPDVYLYYIITFFMPLIIGWRRLQKTTAA